ncbi:MAG: rhomboid family intramembrane serine protease [Candidatus Zapsychrus exili]|nr:rhomboid family intramembrane serine protease [Candidatus Zapsychrus exili]
MPNNKEIKIEGFWNFIFRSKVALFLILLNSVVFFLLKNSPNKEQYFQAFIFHPLNVMKGNYLCFITSGFVHLEWSHLLLNMLAVFVFTWIVEKHLGIFKTILIYFGSLSVSMIFSCIVYFFFLKKNMIIIGASGAVMGIISAAMLLEPFCITYEMILPIPIMIKGWMFIYADLVGFLSGESDGVSHIAHLFGFLSIAIVVYMLSSEDRRKMRTGFVINIASFVVFILLRNYLINVL